MLTLTFLSLGKLSKDPFQQSTFLRVLSAMDSRFSAIWVGLCFSKSVHDV